MDFDFKVDDGLNSGVQIRSRCYDRPTEFEWKGKIYKEATGCVHGLQVEIDPSARAWTAGIQEEGGRAWLNDLKNNEPARKAFKACEWNTIHVECRGESIKTTLNGVPAADLTDNRVMSGFIGLEVHVVGKKGNTLRSPLPQPPVEGIVTEIGLIHPEVATLGAP